VTIAKRPSHGARDGGGCRDDLPDEQSEIFFAKGLDTRISVDPVGKIGLLAQLRRSDFRYDEVRLTRQPGNDSFESAIIWSAQLPEIPRVRK